MSDLMSEKITSTEFLFKMRLFFPTTVKHLNIELLPAEELSICMDVFSYSNNEYFCF